MTQAESNPVLEKIRSIHVLGEAAYQAGTVKLFTGFPDSLRNRFNVCVVIDGSELSEKICRAAESLGLEFILAGRNFPLHSTMLEGLWEGDLENRDVVFGRVLQEITPRLEEFPPPMPHYHRLVLDGSGNLLLLSTYVPGEVLRLREYLTEVYERQGLKPLPLDNLFHCTVMRFRDVSANTLGVLRRFHQFVDDMNTGRACEFATHKRQFYRGPALGVFQGAVPVV